MKQIDATKYLRQMKYLPDWASISGILLLIMIIFVSLPFPPIDGWYWRVLEKPEAKFAHHEPFPDTNTPNIYVKRNGEFFIMDEHVADIDHLRKRLSVMMKENQYGMKNHHKMLLTMDIHVPWGNICEIMRVLKDNQIKAIGLITEGSTTYIDFYQQRRLYKEIGLRLPESAR